MSQEVGHASKSRCVYRVFCGIWSRQRLVSTPEPVRRPLFSLVPGGVWPQGLVLRRRFETMGISVGIFVVAVGAILRYAVSTHVDGINLGIVGVILMIAGVVGALASAVFWSSFSPYDRHHPAVVRESDAV
jgi:hypothetical protein